MLFQYRIGKSRLLLNLSWLKYIQSCCLPTNINKWLPLKCLCDCIPVVMVSSCTSVADTPPIMHFCCGQTHLYIQKVQHYSIICLALRCSVTRINIYTEAIFLELHSTHFRKEIWNLQIYTACSHTLKPESYLAVTQQWLWDLWNQAIHLTYCTLHFQLYIIIVKSYTILTWL